MSKEFVVGSCYEAGLYDTKGSYWSDPCSYLQWMASQTSHYPGTCTDTSDIQWDANMAAASDIYINSADIIVSY